MVDLSLVHSIRHRQLLLQGLCELFKLGLIHPGELCFVILVKFGRAHLECQIFIVLSFLRFLVFFAKGDIDRNEFTILLLFPGLVVLAPLLLISFVVVS
jgi:hypothetical protein